MKGSGKKNKTTFLNYLFTLQRHRTDDPDYQQ